ncbi:MAG: hypothetical protein ICV83_15765 [Cytophagales bacterium]|nr:hypothetical protein [Cytophagales bacterium]
MIRFASGRWSATALPALLVLSWLCCSGRAEAAPPPPDHFPGDSTGRTRVYILPTPGPGNRVQLHLNRPPAGLLLVTIQDRLGQTHYQRWHAAGNRIMVHFDDTGRSLSPGLYSAVVSTGNLFVKTKFVVE